METVEIREDTTYLPFCRVCKAVIGKPVEFWREASIAATRHELEQHPDPEPEDG